MGSTLNKDKNIKMYMTLNQSVYYSGDIVEGVVHIQSLAECQYHTLNLLIQGKQEIMWVQTYNKTVIVYTNKKDTYHEDLQLASFNMGIRAGHYSFPFTIALPNTMPGSFTLDSSNYIKYTISAIIHPFNAKNQSQCFEMPLHIRQPSRIKKDRFNVQGQSQSICCNCCCGCGTVSLQLQADIGQLTADRTFNVRGGVDNSLGNTKIKNVKLVLIQMIKKISEWEFKKVTKRQFVIKEFLKEVQIGEIKYLNAQVRISNQVQGYTCIGSIIYRAYFLALIGEVNCCYSNPKIMKHIVLNNSFHPKTEENELKEQPVDWNPQMREPVAFINLKPYIYCPSKSIDVTNQAGSVVSQMTERQSIHIVLSNDS